MVVSFLSWVRTRPRNHHEQGEIHASPALALDSHSLELHRDWADGYEYSDLPNLPLGRSRCELQNQFVDRGVVDHIADVDREYLDREWQFDDGYVGDARPSRNRNQLRIRSDCIHEVQCVVGWDTLHGIEQIRVLTNVGVCTSCQPSQNSMDSETYYANWHNCGPLHLKRVRQILESQAIS